MIKRFCLYGFLKNQKYYEPFMIMAFMCYGLSFTMIGLLIAAREIWINVLEVPTGVLADIFGRRKAMVASFIAYILFLLTMSYARELWLFFVAMFFFAIGEVFRTGTHKAIIFDWLASVGRADEKTKVYGITRSWSKMGSVISIPIAITALFMADADNYNILFLLCIIPYLANIINLLSYPQFLDRGNEDQKQLGAILQALGRALKHIIKFPPLRNVLLQAMSYEGLFKVSDSYLQPFMKFMVLGLPVLLTLQGQQRTAVMVGAVYMVIYFVSSIASRRASNFASKHGWSKASGRLWLAYLVAFVLLGGSILCHWALMIVGVFVLLALLQNLWRPILVSRCGELAETKELATVLSVESQLKALFTAITAPVLGVTVDMLVKVAPEWKFLPLAILGIVVALFYLVCELKGIKKRCNL